VTYGGPTTVIPVVSVSGPPRTAVPGGMCWAGCGTVGISLCGRTTGWLLWDGPVHDEQSIYGEQSSMEGPSGRTENLAAGRRIGEVATHPHAPNVWRFRGNDNRSHTPNERICGPEHRHLRHQA
jgi:hypothetical protein